MKLIIVLFVLVCVALMISATPLNNLGGGQAGHGGEQGGPGGFPGGPPPGGFPGGPPPGGFPGNFTTLPYQNVTASG